VRIAVTGRPGIGKTTLCLKVYDGLKEKLRISGFVTKEVREGFRRVGFKLIDLSGGREVWLARVGEGKVKVGEYAVFVDNLENFLRSVDMYCDLLIIDEVGPMELKSRKFVDFMVDAMEMENVLVTIHYRSKHWLIERIRRTFKVYTIDERSRDVVAREIVRSYDR